MLGFPNFSTYLTPSLEHPSVSAFLPPPIPVRRVCIPFGKYFFPPKSVDNSIKFMLVVLKDVDFDSDNPGY